MDPEKSKDEEPDLKSKFLETEKKKPPLKDFTLNEYTEKVIQYGFIMVSLELCVGKSKTDTVVSDVLSSHY